MALIDIRDTSLNYRFDGPEDAPVLLFANSLGTNLAMWDAQVAGLSERFLILRYDMRGHGASADPPGPYDIEGLARDVLDLLNGLDLARVNFCGLSLGGMVGMWLGVNAPDRLDRLVLANTAALIGPRDIWDARIAAVERGGMQAVAETVLERWFTPAFRELEPAAIARVREMLLTTPVRGYVAACAAVRDMDQRETIKAIATPTLVIAGAADPSTPPAQGQYIAQQIRAARYVELPAAHLSNVEAEAQFTRSLLEFFSA